MSGLDHDTIAHELDGLLAGRTPMPAGEADVPLTYHRLIPADDLAEGASHPATVDGVHLAVFRHQGQ
ncbi:MAG: hypothetical protein ABIL09_30205, partial [Gemmatimonadota bacterium]